MEIDTSRGAIRHGELLLRPVLSVPEGKTITTNNHVCAHSESGAHHVLEATDFEVTTVKNDDGTETMYLSMPNDGQLVHKKVGPDQHPTLPVVKGNYVVMTKTEFDPFALRRQMVAD